MPHIHEKIDFTATTYIVNDNAVLLRKHDKYNLWLAPGGHIELDETPTAAALREVKEEVGLDVVLFGSVAQQSEGDGYEELLPPAFMNIHPINDTHKHIDLIYIATCDSREVTQGDTEVSDEIRWFTKEELDDSGFDIRATIVHYGKQAIDAVSQA